MNRNRGREDLTSQDGLVFAYRIDGEHKSQSIGWEELAATQKREGIILRRYIAPQRDALSQLTSAKPSRNGHSSGQSFCRVESSAKCPGGKSFPLAIPGPRERLPGRFAEVLPVVDREAAEVGAAVGDRDAGHLAA